MLVERTAESELRASGVRWVLGLGSAAMIILLVFASVVIERETVRREEITQTLHRHADLLEQAHDSLFAWPLGGAIGYWNRGAETLYGYTREEAVGRSSHELLQTQHPLGVAQIDAMLERDGRWKGELTQTAKDGRKLVLDAHWTVMVDGKGNKTVLEANRDITEHKRADVALRESEHRYRQLFDEMVDGFALLGAIYDENGKPCDFRYLEVNPAFETHTGLLRNGVVGRTIREIFVNIEPFWIETYGKVATTGEPVHFEKYLEPVQKWLEVSAFRTHAGHVSTMFTDITARKRAEAKNLLLATAIEQAAETVVITGRDATIQYVNPAFTRTTGYTRGEALGQNPHVLKSGQHDAKFYHELWATITAGKLWHGEFTNRRKDGTLYIEEGTIAPVRDVSGEITNYIAIKSDITERKRAEEALRESEEKYRSLVSNIPDVSWTLDAKRRFVFISNNIEKVSGYSPDEVYQNGTHLYLSSLHPDDIPKVNESFRALFAEGRPFDVEVRAQRKDGQWRWVQHRALVTYEKNGMRYADGLLSDITERKQAEEALAESELHYRQLFERSESALAMHEMVFDAQGNPSDFRYLDVNPAFERMTGLKRSQVLGHTAVEINPSLEESWFQLFARVAATGEPEAFENYTSSLGRYYAGSAYSLRPNQVASNFTDVTERKQAEAEVLLLNAELEERVRSRTLDLETANRELEAFAHSVSHDLRAPLRGIDGWSLALLEDCGERLDAQGHKYLDRVRSEAQRMGTLIDDLLKLSRINRGELVSATVDLTSLAGTIVARLKEAHPDRSIEFIIAPQLKCTGDARLLEIALTNLLNNAVKLTGPRNPARVEFGKTECEGSPAFFVRDNGVGFDMNYAKMLFAPFQRLHKASEFPGTGIGLATVQRVIHRHGGRIWADARIGAGATLYFTLGENKP